MARKKKSVRKFVRISDVSGSKAEADRIRALDQERQQELRQDLIDAARKSAKRKSTTEKIFTPQRFRVVRGGSSLVAALNPAHEESPKIPSLDTGDFARACIPALADTVGIAEVPPNQSVQKIGKSQPTKKRKKKKKKVVIEKTSTDLLDSKLMYRGSYGTGKRSKGY